ncbi:MAG TPA: AI-2E family transporter [Stellaceae bacterium]|nr:AI-2E family transporter [Stellaceae bacterium]
MTPAQRNTSFWVGGLACFFLLLWLLSPILLPFVAGFAIAYFLDPLAERLVRIKVPRGLASFIVLLWFLLILVLIFLLLVPILQSQVLDLIGNTPQLIATARHEAESLMQMAQERLSPEDLAKLRDAVGGKIADVVGWAGGVLRDLLTRGLALANLLSLVFVTPVVAFFLLRDWDRIVARVDSWLPRAQAETIREQARLIDETLAGFLRGQLSVCVVLAIYYAIGLSLLGLNFGLVIGLLIGLFAFIPYIGGIFGFALSMLLAFTQFREWHNIVYIVVLFLVGWTVEGNVLTPKLVGERVNLHPVWVIFALLAFGSLFGFLGVLIAVPIAAILGVLVRFALSQYLASQFYDPARSRPRRGDG